MSTPQAVLNAPSHNGSGIYASWKNWYRKFSNIFVWGSTVEEHDRNLHNLLERLVKVPKLASMAKRLWDLLRDSKSNAKLDWRDEHTNALNQIKNGIVTKAMSYFRRDWRTHLEVDASPVRAVPSQSRRESAPHRSMLEPTAVRHRAQVLASRMRSTDSGASLQAFPLLPDRLRVHTSNGLQSSRADPPQLKR
jgi:hypothetical protein